MFVQERQERIAALAARDGNVLVKDLSRQFGVTEDCIRKDLAALEKKGLLRRVYGGAVPARANLHEYDVAQRRNENVEEKRRLAAKALRLVHDGDTLFLDISTTNVELAKLLLRQERGVTVATNMVDVMTVLSAPCGVGLYFIGGAFNRGRDGFIGSAAVAQIARLRCDLAFLGTVGVDVSGDAVYTYLPDDGYTKQAILGASRASYLLVEKRKFQAEGNFKYAALGDFRGAVTDLAPGDPVAARLARGGLTVL